MKKLIFRNIFKDISYLFIIISLALTLIVWVIQAVNYLDIVSEDGHNFSVYFKFSLLSSYFETVKNTDIKKTNKINLLKIFGRDNKEYIKYTPKLCPSSDTKSK